MFMKHVLSYLFPNGVGINSIADHFDSNIAFKHNFSSMSKIIIKIYAL